MDENGQKVTATVTVAHAQGMHARPAAQIVRRLAAFKAKVTLIKESDGSAADCRSALALLCLAATDGTKMKLIGEGEDAEKAVESIVRFFESGFSE